MIEQRLNRCFWLISMIAIVFAQPAHAQLGLLSRGDSTAQWRSTQLELIEQQLADAAVKGPLRKELESQKNWLNQWQPGQLKEGPWIKQREQPSPLVEPNLDPEKTATGLRGRLLGKDAKPTAKDTTELQKLLEKAPEDLGLQQLYLHWIDQKVYRDQYAGKIVEAGRKLADALSQIEDQDESLKAARAYCYYRAARALIHQESPEMQAKSPIKDLAKHEAELLALYSQIGELVGNDRTEFILLNVRMLRRDHWNGQALMLVEENAERLENQWYLRHRRELLNDLGWAQPAKEATELSSASATKESATKEKVR